MKSDLINVLKQSIDIFYQNDADLIRRDVHEQTISGRLAHYFENIIQNYVAYKTRGCSVDVEYNRNFNDPKKIFSPCKHCNEDCLLISENNYLEEKDARPDIIVHKRNSNEENLLVIEIKKELNLQNSEQREAKQKDIKKLTYFTCQKCVPTSENDFVYKYLLGCFINFNQESCEIEFFENTEKVDSQTYNILKRAWFKGLSNE